MQRASWLRPATVAVVCAAAVGAGLWLGFVPGRGPPPVPAPASTSAPAANQSAASTPAQAPSPTQATPAQPAPAAPVQKEASAPPAPAAAAPPAAVSAPAPTVPAKPAAVAPAPSPQPAASAATTPPAQQKPQEAIKPSFDIVRVNPQGGAVMAGRAAPGAEVNVAENGRQIGSTTADEQGQWVLLPDKPIAPGSSELTVASREPDQKKPVQGEAPVVILMPQKPASPATAASSAPAAAPAPSAAPLVVMTPNGAVPKVMQEPEPRTQGRLGLATVDYTDQGKIRFAGSAPPGATVRTYIDNQPAGDAAADANGHWTLTPDAPVPVGDHKLRLDQLASQGHVSSRIELPFQRDELPPQEVAEGSTVVQPGQNLWRIARHAYGRGVQYVVIYQANRGQIRNPNLIYPGQIFSIPAAPAPAASSQ